MVDEPFDGNVDILKEVARVVMAGYSKKIKVVITSSFRSNKKTEYSSVFLLLSVCRGYMRDSAPYPSTTYTLEGIVCILVYLIYNTCVWCSMGNQSI